MLLGLLGLGAVACQNQGATATAPVSVIPNRSQSIASASVAKEFSNIRLAARDSLAPAMRMFARRHDLSAVWQGKEYSANEQKPTVCEGFFGSDHYRIELVLLEVSRDATDSLLYYVQGKDRYKKRVSSFAGAIRLERLRRVSIKSFEDELQGAFARFYTARGEFQFREVDTVHPGTFTGSIGIDFQQKADSSLVPDYFWGDEHRQYANGGKLRLSGKWISIKTGIRKKFLAGANLEGISREIVPDFNIGERGFTLNPKYAHLGWDKYWQNDEWWATSPKPSLGL